MVWFHVPNEEDVVRAPMCIWPTRSTNMAKLEMKRSKARMPHGPKGNHDHRTGHYNAFVSSSFS